MHRSVLSTVNGEDTLKVVYKLEKLSNSWKDDDFNVICNDVSDDVTSYSIVKSHFGFVAQALHYHNDGFDVSDHILVWSVYACSPVKLCDGTRLPPELIGLDERDDKLYGFRLDFTELEEIISFVKEVSGELQ